MVRNKLVFRAVVATSALMWYLLLVFTVRNGNWLFAPVGVWMASPVTMTIVARTLERHVRVRPFRLRDQAWSFAYGDTFALAGAVVFAALAWRSVPESGWHTSWWWIALCACLGVIAGVAFHLFDAGYYRSCGAESCLIAPTKEVHDWLSAYPVLFGGLLYAGMPVLIFWNWWSLGVVIGVAAWIGLALRDMKFRPDPFAAHPGGWSWT